jgi:hypothetical protein
MIFQSTLQTLDSELSQLQTLLETKRQQRNLYSQLQTQTEGYLQGLSKLKNQIGEAIGTDAIASLKSAVLSLFGTDDGGNLPTEPTPNPDGDAPKQESDANVDDTQIPETLSTGARFWFGAVSNTGTVIKVLKADEYRCQIDGAVGEVELERHRLHYIPTQLEGQHCDIDAAPLTGQHCQFTSHWEHDWELEPLDGQAWEIATPLCCLLSDAPRHNENKGTTKAGDMAYIELVTHPENKAISYQRRKHDGQLICVYVGCNNQSRLSSWAEWIYRQEWGLTRQQCYSTRNAKRLTQFKYELKLPALSLNRINLLAAQDFTKQPTLPHVVPQPAPKAEPKIKIGDKIVPTLTPGETFEAKSEPVVDGSFFAVSLLDGRRQLLKVNAVTVVERKAEPAADEPIDPLTNILEVNDTVEILEAPLRGEVGKVSEINRYSELPLLVRCADGRQFSFKRCELKFISRPDRKQPQVAVPKAFTASRYSKSFVGC